MDIPEADAVAFAEVLAKRNGYISLDSPDKVTRGWYVRMARAILAERERCAKVCEAVGSDLEPTHWMPIPAPPPS